MQRSFTFALLLVVCFVCIGPLAAQDAPTPEPIPERGPYQVASHTFTWVDESRDNREVSAIVWYPAAYSDNLRTQFMRAEMSHIPVADIAPDLTGAPYPVVMYSHGDHGQSSVESGSPTELAEVLEPLASHGFVVANIIHPDVISAQTILDRPMDARFVLDQLAAVNEDPTNALSGVMNTDQAGVVGFADGATAAILLGGARVDPAVAQAYFLSMSGLLSTNYKDWNWNSFSEYHHLTQPDADESLWPAMTDQRIRAVVAYLPCNVGLFSEQGLASATVPTLLIGATADVECEYANAVVALNQLGSTDRNLLTLVGGTHHPPSGRDNPVPVIQQYVTAYLGNVLQGKSEYAGYLTPAFASTLRNVVWGVDEASVPDLDLTNLHFTPVGSMTLGEPTLGSIERVGERVGYSLTLSEDTVLNMVANSAGMNAEGNLFDPVLYVVNDHGVVIAWNEEQVMSAFDGVWDAGLQDFTLADGTYSIVVGGFRNHVGSFSLLVEAAQ